MPTTANNQTSQTLPVSVITTCYGRNDHLYNVLASLQSSSYRPAEVVIVNDDADNETLNQFDLNILKIATNMADESVDGKPVKFDIGINRNKGVQAATFEALIFLDVDCIVSHYFIEGLYQKLIQHPNSLLMGQPRYLTKPLNKDQAVRLYQSKKSDLIDEWLHEMSILNPYRHNVYDGVVLKAGDNQQLLNIIEKTDDYGAFWSLCFAITKSTFNNIGGFDLNYVGYGAEDTDFAFTARRLDIALYLTGDVTYHQQHTVYRPPLNHLESIIINANYFYQKWQHWAMTGWLQAFVDKGLIEWRSDQTYPISLLRQPTKFELDAACCPDAPFV